MNPKMVIFDSEDVYQTMRIRMAKWMGGGLAAWDAMSYEDQCYAMEISRADRKIDDYDAAKARSQAAAQARRRAKGRRR